MPIKYYDCENIMILPAFWIEYKHCTSWYCQHLINVHGCKVTQILCAHYLKEVKAFDETLECKNCYEVWYEKYGDKKFDKVNILCLQCKLKENGLL
jgi:hypothetical protein